MSSLSRKLTLILPTPRAALIVAAGAPIWALAFTSWGSVVALLATLSIVAAIMFDLVRLPSPSALDVSRILPDTAGLGDEVGGSYDVVSRWNRELNGVVFDAIPRELETQFISNRFVLQPRERQDIEFKLRPAKRGTWLLGTIAVRVTAPLGLLQRTIRYEPGDSITVAPSLKPVRNYRLIAMQHRLHEAGVKAVRRRGEGRSFSNLRAYTPGDDPRIIDWKHSARRGKLISREFTEERGQTIMIVVDAGRMMTQMVGDVPRFEYALSSAMVLASVAANGEDRVGLMVFDEAPRVYVPPAKGTQSLIAIREALIPVQPVFSEPDYATAFATLATRQRSRALIVFFTDVIDVRASRSLIANTIRRGSRHMHLVVALRNDSLFSAAKPDASRGIRSVYDSAAAEELVLARNAALEKMRLANIAVVDVSPSAMTAAVVNRYLEIKSRGDL
jgi:uncharacterized protein (DUF58 family)